MDQGPTALALYVRQRRHRPVDLAHQVHVDNPGELLGGRLLEGGQQPYPGQVHPRVECAVLLHGAVGHGLYLLKVRSVGGDGDGLAALVPYLLYYSGSQCS